MPFITFPLLSFGFDPTALDINIQGHSQIPYLADHGNRTALAIKPQAYSELLFSRGRRGGFHSCPVPRSVGASPALQKDQYQGLSHTGKCHVP